MGTLLMLMMYRYQDVMEGKRRKGINSNIHDHNEKQKLNEHEKELLFNLKTRKKKQI